MILEQAFVDKVTSAVAITNVIGTRFYPHIAPQDALLPLGLYRRIATSPLQTIKGPVSTGTTNVRMQCEWLTNSYETAKQLAAAARDVLDGWSQPADNIDGCALDSEVDDAEQDSVGSQTILYRVTQEYSVWTVE